MTVQELRETLGRLVTLLESADAKVATTRELTEFIELTSGFGELNLKAFVKLAETGRAPKSVAPSPTPRPRTGGAVPVDPVALSTEVTGLYERAADPNVTEEQIRAACERLGPLKKDALVKLAEGIGLSGMKTKKNADIGTAITARLLDRKGAAIRSQLTERPTPAAS